MTHHTPPAMIKVTKEELALAQHQFFTLSLDLLCLAGFDGYFIALNPAWEKVLGFSEAELCSKPFVEFVHPDDRESTLEAAGKLSNRESDIVGFRNRYLTKSGDYKWLDWSATFDPTESYILASARDVTHNIEQEAQMKQMIETRDRMLRTLSHDIKEPVRSIRAFTTIVQDELRTDTSLTPYLNLILNGTEHLHEMVLKLQEFVQFGENASGSSDAVSVTRTIIDVLLQDQIARTDTSITTHFNSPAAPVQIQKVALTSILQNLLSNAIKYRSSDHKCEIEISIHRTPEMTSIEIKDNGIGISQTDKERIFDLFYQTNRLSEGFGMGLAICKRAVDAVGGSIEIDSEIGKGSAFTIKIPTLTEP